MSLVSELVVEIEESERLFELGVTDEGGSGGGARIGLASMFTTEIQILLHLSFNPAILAPCLLNTLLEPLPYDQMKICLLQTSGPKCVFSVLR